jgi:hypothetical protein
MTRYELPTLPYDHGALAPHISAQVMELHHTKHHQAYVNGANQTLDRLAEARACDADAVPPRESWPPRSPSSSAASRGCEPRSIGRWQVCRVPAGRCCRGSRWASG